MSYNKKIIITIFLLVTIVVAFVFYKLFSISFEYVPCQFENIRCLIPANFELSSYHKNQWQGKNAFNHSRSQWIYIVRKSHIRSTTLQNYFLKPKKIKYLKINDNFLFGIHPRGKSYRRYIYLFYYDNYAYWIESGTNNSTLLQVKENADKILTSLKINGKNPFSDLESTVKKTTSFVTPRYSQSPTFFLFIFIGVLLLTYLIAIVIFHFSNQEPKEFIEPPLQLFKGITFKISFQPFSMQMYDGLVVSTKKEIHLYTFKKAIIRINLDDINDLTQVKIGRTFLFKQDYITFLFPEPIRVNVPGRKKSLRAKKITIYLEMDKIRKLLLETDFPFKEQLIQSNYI